MSRCIRVIVLMLLLPGVTNSQQVSFGPVGGVAHSFFHFSDNTGLDSKFHAACQAGVILAYTIRSHWAIEAGVRFSSEGGTVNHRVMNDNHTYNYRPNYIRVPVHLNYFFGKPNEKFRPLVSLGPCMGFLTGGRSKMEINGEQTESANAKELFNSFDIGLNLGAGMQVGFLKTSFLQVRLLYYQGISNAFDNISVMKVRNRQLGLEIGMRFPVARI